MNTNDCIRINIPKIVHENIDGETVILNLDDGNYYSLVGTGADIWECLENGANIRDVIERLYTKYDGVRENMEKAAHVFISELMQEGLIVTDGTGPDSGSGCFHAKVETGNKESKPVFEAPVLNKYSDMQDLLLLDPIHDVDETGWPTVKKDPSSKDQ